MIPTPPGPGDIPVGPERPEPIRTVSPRAAALSDELEDLKHRLRDLAERLVAVEERVSRLEGHRH